MPTKPQKAVTPTDDKKQPDEEQRAEAAAGAAIAESIADDGLLTLEFRGEKFEFKAKRLNAMQFRLPMQQGNDAMAVEWLIGRAQFARFLAVTSDEDGCSPLDAFLEFLRAIGEAGGIPNS
jgi:hypothetical protein